MLADHVVFFSGWYIYDSLMANIPQLLYTFNYPIGCFLHCNYKTNMITYGTVIFKLKSIKSIEFRKKKCMLEKNVTLETDGPKSPLQLLVYM